MKVLASRSGLVVGMGWLTLKIFRSRRDRRKSITDTLRISKILTASIFWMDLVTPASIPPLFAGRPVSYGQCDNIRKRLKLLEDFPFDQPFNCSLISARLLSLTLAGDRLIGDDVQAFGHPQG